VKGGKRISPKKKGNKTFCVEKEWDGYLLLIKEVRSLLLQANGKTTLSRERRKEYFLRYEV
jgi:hypothetical protein